MTGFRVAVLLGLCLVAGCGLVPTAAPHLDGTSWRAVTVAGKVPVAGSEPTVTFGSGIISGSTGCNRYSGPIRLEGSRLTLTELSQTLIGCDGMIGEIEEEFSRVLGRAETIRFEGASLVIAGRGGEIVLRADVTVP